MKKVFIILFIITAVVAGIFVIWQKTFLPKTEIRVKQQKTEAIISPTENNVIKGTISIVLTQFPEGTERAAFALIPQGRQLEVQNVIGWDEDISDGLSLEFDTATSENGDYTLAAMAIKIKGQDPLGVVSTKVIIRN